MVRRALTPLDDDEMFHLALSEEYSFINQPSDGEIYLRLRDLKYKSFEQGSSFAQKRLWARLSKDKRKDLKLLWDRHPDLTRALDRLRTLPGLWYGFRISHKYLSMKCDEVWPT